MRLTLDVEEMRCSIELWRQVLALPGQSSDQLAPVIADARGRVAGWADLLRLSTAEPAESQQLKSLRAEVAAFGEWLQEAQSAIALASKLGSARSPPDDR